MKKLMSVLILVTFLGSLIVMTGCFGGDDGIGAIIGAAVFVLAISASGGTSAAVFAANTRDSLRPAISFATTKPKIVITPLNADGTEAASSYTIESDKLTAPTNAGDPIKAEYQISDNYNQYMVKVYANNQLIHQGVQYVATAQKTGASTKVNLTVDNNSTAKAKVFTNWNKTATRRSYSDFSYNLSQSAGADITTIETTIQNALAAWTTTDLSAAPVYTGADALAVTEAADVSTTYTVYNISGYVKQIDGAGSSNAYVYLANADRTINKHVLCSNGYYTFTDVVPGTYTLTPSLANHSFTPCCYENVVVSNADIAGKDFQATAPTATTPSIR